MHRVQPARRLANDIEVGWAAGELGRGVIHISLLEERSVSLMWLLLLLSSEAHSTKREVGDGNGIGPKSQQKGWNQTSQPPKGDMKGLKHCVICFCCNTRCGTSSVCSVKYIYTDKSGEHSSIRTMTPYPDSHAATAWERKGRKVYYTLVRDYRDCKLNRRNRCNDATACSHCQPIEMPTWL